MRFSFKLRLALQAVAEASSHLPTYEAQQLQACIKGLREGLLQLRAQCEPKKRFSFARKAALAQAEPAGLPTGPCGDRQSMPETGMAQQSDMMQHKASEQDRPVMPEGNLHTGTSGSSAAPPHDTGSALSGRCCTHSSPSCVLALARATQQSTRTGAGNTAEYSHWRGQHSRVVRLHAHSTRLACWPRLRVLPADSKVQQENRCGLSLQAHLRKAG